jgi:hypothetical protein
MTYQTQTVPQHMKYSTVYVPVVSTMQGGHKEMSSILADLERPCIWAQMLGVGRGFAGSQPTSIEAESKEKYGVWVPSQSWL